MAKSNYFPFNAATLDMRFDHSPFDVNRNGHKVNSFENTKPFLDHIKANGYDTVMFVTNVPVNTKTGLVDTTAEVGDTPAGMEDRGYPDDLVKMIQYAESIGLNTHLQLEIVDYLTDQIITDQSLPRGTDIPRLFKSIGEYQVATAQVAERLGVDSINLGAYNQGLNDSSDVLYWKENIESIRKVFSGYLSYTADWRDSTPVLDLVDFKILHFLPHLANQHTESVAELMLKYFDPDGESYDLVARLKELSQGDQEVVLMSRISAVTNYPGEYHVSWMPWAGDSAPQWAQQYLNKFPDFTNQLNQYRALFEIVGDQLANDIDGILVTEYAPWLESAHYQTPSTDLDKNYHVYHKVSSYLNWNWNPEAYKVIKEYAEADWGSHSIHLGTVNNDQLTGSTQADKFVWRGGSDLYDGGAGTDSLIMLDSKNNWTLSESRGQKTLNKNDIILTLISIENIEFLDGSAVSYNTITGTSKKDTLTGTAGNDIIYGKEGVDKLTGGDGEDQFVFDTLPYTVSIFGRFKFGKNQDTIVDFDPDKDQLVFDTKVFDKFAGDTDWTDNVAVGFANQDANDWLVYDAGRIYYDINGSLPKNSSLIVQLIGSPELTFDNVVFI